MVYQSVVLACAISTAFILSQPTRAADLVKPTKIGDINFLIPADCELQLVTNESLIKWPVVVDWDSHGNLLVVESGGVGKPIEEHNLKALHRIVRLDDSNNDGVFDKRTVVADNLPFTEGVLALGRDLLACAPPHILRLTDEDGDGTCEKRSIWFDGQTITGCANDLHGPYLGRDGWVYWCKGAFAEQNHQLLNGQTLKTSAAHIFRRRLEGGPIEPVMSGGMDNPVEVAITPEGERFFTSTFLVHPGQGKRDGIAHAVYGGLFGKPHKVIDGHPRTGPLMPIMVHLGAAAPSGLICLNSTSLVTPSQPDERILVAALFNLQKVTANRLQPAGAGYTSRSSDLVVADRIDFHPTDILEQPDGSLLIVDTGGWYDLCCPSSRIDQTTASGGIYRLSRAKSSDAANVPSGLVRADGRPKLPGLLNDLIDERPWVARSAQQKLATLESNEAAKIARELTVHVADSKLLLKDRLNLLWAACGLGLPGQHALRNFLASNEPSVLQAACHAVSVMRLHDAKSAMEKLVQHPSLAVRRTAAEALGRIGDSKSVQALFQGLQDLTDPDRALEHSITYALYELNAIEGAAQYANEQSTPRQQQAAMVALDMLHSADLLPVDFMLAAVSSDDPQVASVAAELLGKNPAWASRYAERLQSRFGLAMQRGNLTDTELTIARGWKDTSVVRQLTGRWIHQAEQLEPAQQLSTIQLIEVYSGMSLDNDWASPIANWLVKANPEIRSQLVSVLANLDLSQSSSVQDRLLQLAGETPTQSEQLALLAALPKGASIQDSKLEATLLQALQSENAGNLQAALQSLKRVHLSDASARRLLGLLDQLQPRSLAIAFEAINRLNSDALDSELLKTCQHLPAAKTLSMDQLRNAYRNRSKDLQNLAEATVHQLTRSSDDIESKVDATLARLSNGDAIRGLTLFRSQKTACSGCHRIGYVGGEIGPELTRIGASRTRRALLEAILFPSARLEQSYQPTKVLTKDGQVYNGLTKRQIDANHLELQLTVDKSVTIDVADIERQEPSSVSIMPSGMAELLTIQELSDLMALLESSR